jgi:hypothetical protein
MIQRGTYVRIGSAGVVGVFTSAYENPVRPRGYLDRANVSVGVETWCANTADLRPVVAGPIKLEVV